MPLIVLTHCNRQEFDIDWFVVDHYGLDVNWESLLLAGHAGKAPSKLLVIDDLADRQHQADLLLDQFFGDLADQRYESLVSPVCRQLLGPHYALLGPEYPFLYPLVPERREVRRVLVFWCMDPCNLTGRTLEALMDPELAHLSVDVVLGHQALHRQQIADLVGQRPFTTLHSQLPVLRDLSHGPMWRSAPVDLLHGSVPVSDCQVLLLQVPRIKFHLLRLCTRQAIISCLGVLRRCL